MSSALPPIIILVILIRCMLTCLVCHLFLCFELVIQPASKEILEPLIHLLVSMDIEVQRASSHALSNLALRGPGTAGNNSVCVWGVCVWVWGVCVWVCWWYLVEEQFLRDEKVTWTFCHEIEFIWPSLFYLSLAYTAVTCDSSLLSKSTPGKVKF